MKYEVIFTQEYCYEVEAETEEEAFDLALNEFEDETSSPVANTDYNDYEIIPVKE